MKIHPFFRWFINHKIISIVALLVLIWAGRNAWMFASYKFFSHPPSTYVETVVLKPQASSQRWQAVGTIKAAQDIMISSEVNGTIQTLNASSGQNVKQGDVILTIRHDDISANLQHDQAIQTQKKLFLQRLQKLVKPGAISEEAFNEAQSAFQQAEATVLADQAALDKYIIKAPFAGDTGIWQVNVGQLVRPGDPLISLTQLAPAYIDFTLPANALNDIHVNDDIQFTTMSFAGRTWFGKITAIDPQLDRSTRSMQLRAETDNKDGKLVPGLYGEVSVVKPRASQLLIPQEAVIYDPAGASVYVLHNNVATPQHVTLGEHQANMVLVASGLKAGDEVVTAGMMKLFPGMPVEVNKRVQQ